MTMHKQYTLYLLRLLIYAVLCLGADIQDVINITPGTTSGGCGSYFDFTRNTGALTDIWTDSIAMNVNAIKLVTAAMEESDNPTFETLQAQHLIATFFGTARDYDKILTWYNDVGRLLNGATNAIDYYLFCDSTYELKTTSSSMAKDTNGNPTSETIAQAYSSLALDFRSFAPFWIETLRIYVFDVRSHDPNTYCTLPNSLGLTQFSTNALAILVCERSFTEEGVDVRLGDTMPTSTGDDIQLFGCVAMTFYHELFHAVHGLNQAIDNTGYGARDIVNNALSVLLAEFNGVPNANRKTLQAPENYTWFALAAWFFYERGVFFNGGFSELALPD